MSHRPVVAVVGGGVKGATDVVAVVADCCQQWMDGVQHVVAAVVVVQVGVLMVILIFVGRPRHQ